MLICIKHIAFSLLNLYPIQKIRCQVVIYEYLGWGGFVSSVPVIKIACDRGRCAATAIAFFLCASLNKPVFIRLQPQ